MSLLAGGTVCPTVNGWGVDMDWCSTPRTPNLPWRGVYSGVVLAGIGMGLVVGQGVAAASPSESAGATQSGETSDAGPSASAPSAATDADASTGDSSPDSADDDETDADLTAEAREAEEAAEAEEADEAADRDVADETSDARADDRGVSSRQRSTVTADSTDVDSEAGEDSIGDSAAAPRDDSPEGTASVTDAVTTAAATSPVSATVTVPTTSAGTVRTLVSARPVTVETIVSDLLTWVGVRPLAGNGPAPATPVSALVQSLWLAVRQTQYTWNNQRPTADVTISGPGPGGTVTGSLNAVDYDDVALTYTLAAGPAYGRVSIDAQGHFSYVPGASAAGRADQFTVRIDDTSGNPFHVHGLLGLLGLSKPTEVTVVVASGSPVRQGVSPTYDIGELASRDGVGIVTDRRGAVSVIEGRFTDEVVVNAADAAAVLNALAPVFGAVAGFADPAAVTTSSAGMGDTAEHFYRFAENYRGIPVLGSEVILVTDADGHVTSVFNYYRGIGEGFDVTPDASVDEAAEVHLIAGTAFLGTGARPGDLDKLLSLSTFTSELVVQALDGEVAPSLAWRAVVRLPDTGDMSSPGATYLIQADGATAGEVIVTFSAVQPVASVITANDWLGDSRAITVDTRTVLWFRTTEMVDGGRGITTYKTSYSMWGLGGPTLPGKVVKRSWLGWDKAAVSAHANTAVVYDFFADVLGRTSYDNAGAPIIVSIKYNPKTGTGYANAFWDPTIKQFAFGDKGYLQAALDIVAHEYTHAVVTSVVGNGAPVLDYGESGALNEAYADILGLLIEGKTDAGRWLIGEDSDLGAIRNLANPSAITTSYGPYRTRYSSRYTGSGDDGGEHVNSTIFGHAAYLMMTDAATSGVSAQTWATVFYHSLGRLNSTATFVDGRAAVLSAAQALGLTSAQRSAIAAAFDAVEIYGAAASSAVVV